MKLSWLLPGASISIKHPQEAKSGRLVLSTCHQAIDTRQNLQTHRLDLPIFCINHDRLELGSSDPEPHSLPVGHCLPSVLIYDVTCLSFFWSACI